MSHRKFVKVVKPYLSPAVEGNKIINVYEIDIHNVYISDLSIEEKVSEIKDILSYEFEEKAIFEVLYLDLSDNFKIKLFESFGFDICNNSVMINKAEGEEMRLIDYCIFYRHYKLAKFLISSGINITPNMKDTQFNISYPTYKSPMRYCIDNIMNNGKYEDYTLLKLLLKHGASPNENFKVRSVTTNFNHIVRILSVLVFYEISPIENGYVVVGKPFDGDEKLLCKTIKILIKYGARFDENIYEHSKNDTYGICKIKFPNNFKMISLICVNINIDLYHE